MDTAKVRLSIPEHIDPTRITGTGDALLRAVEDHTSASIVVRGTAISLSGTPDEVELLCRLFTHIIKLASAGETPSESDALRALDALRAERSDISGLSDDILLTYRGHAIRPKTIGQKRYIDAIRNNTITFCMGPAGTGKTYLAMAIAVAALKRHEVGRIVLTRPVVEAGENLGFLPGTLEEKIDPYVRPLFDALFDMTDMERATTLVEQGIIEIAPLAYMRGRTLNDAIVVLDEAQNTTPEQMKMFLTRLGFNSKFIITGDTTQRDLPGRRGGLTDIEDILSGVDDIAFIHLNRADVVRHALVGRIVEAYDAYEDAHPAGARPQKGGGHGRAHQ
ncbi:PhoH family protein [Collinsella tanakaei]|uniref:PhoH-like protein n=1 Tax=Collinsella ihumii TaxID=1720204 RepID=A0A921LTH5_9ACTN|nr:MULTISPECIES: PhoH family protein [Collinsella]MBM6785809.1 PhoH family protein [Collinsella tanakaei]MBM6905838.1 PhoH family protein [Collinsella tanakaei]MDN0054357.1 PhoH family protein [Collinsella ihumii]OUO62318.1 phosphate starvation-inducible protein PhoH [Collinsella sp. An271]HJG31318.1 PhoH family protein [Collinsella ihumii]